MVLRINNIRFIVPTLFHQKKDQDILCHIFNCLLMFQRYSIRRRIKTICIKWQVNKSCSNAIPLEEGSRHFLITKNFREVRFQRYSIRRRIKTNNICIEQNNILQFQRYSIRRRIKTKKRKSSLKDLQFQRYSIRRRIKTLKFKFILNFTKCSNAIPLEEGSRQTHLRKQQICLQFQRYSIRRRIKTHS